MKTMESRGVAGERGELAAAESVGREVHEALGWACVLCEVVKETCKGEWCKGSAARVRFSRQVYSTTTQ